jgi:DNA-binding transcriptional LysR family regulator
MAYVPEIRLLRYAVAIADELHFAKAAQKLRVSAPSLTKQIKGLETGLGFMLFDRRTRHVALTQPGSAFVAEARLAIGHAERAVEAGRAARGGGQETFLVGYTPFIEPSALEALRLGFQQRGMKTALKFQSAFSKDQSQALLVGALQAGIVLLPFDVEGVRTRCVWQDRLVAAMRHSHPLASRSSVGLAELNGEPIIWIAPPVNPGLHERLLEDCRSQGFLPEIRYEVMTAMEALDLAAGGAGVTFVKAEVARRFSGIGLAFVPLEEPGLRVRIGIAYLSTNRSEPMMTLLRVSRDLSNCGEPWSDPD